MARVVSWFDEGVVIGALRQDGAGEPFAPELPVAWCPSQVERATPTDVTRNAAKIRERLARAIPEPRVELDFESPWQLLIATMLAAQSTDRTINRITPALFRRWPDARALAEADPAEVEQAVRSSGYFRQKARAIMAASRAIVVEFGGEVPKTIEGLTALPGVARKTANVVLGCAYGITSGFVVDTHVTRLAGRLGLSKHGDPVKIEHDLCGLFSRRSWVATSHRLILHGRYVCHAKKAPLCDRCPLNEICPSAEQSPAGSWKARASWEGQLVEAARTAP